MGRGCRRRGRRKRPSRAKAMRKLDLVFSWRAPDLAFASVELVSRCDDACGADKTLRTLRNILVIFLSRQPVQSNLALAVVENT